MIPLELNAPQTWIFWEYFVFVLSYESPDATHLCFPGDKDRKKLHLYYLIGFLHPKGKWSWKLPTSKPMSARQTWISQSYLADIDLEVYNFQLHFKINIIFSNLIISTSFQSLSLFLRQNLSLFSWSSSLFL